MTFVCPRCQGPLGGGRDAYECAACARVYPVVAGIADFRLDPDPYIGIEADRRKAEALWGRGGGGTFAELLRHYYQITPEDPADLAARWIPRALAEPDIARTLLGQYGLVPADGIGQTRLLDVGCSTGGLLVAARGAFGELTGVDVALRWLAVGRVRLREAGVAATLVCANAEHLPFAAGSFTAVTCTDTLEHVRDAAAALADMRRVSAPGARLLATANNRLAPLPEPNIHLWGVAQLPRRWQPAYVRWRRGDLHPYRIRLRSARELGALARQAGFHRVRVGAGPILAPHARSPLLQRALGAYNRLRGAPLVSTALAVAGPKLVVTAEVPRDV